MEYVCLCVCARMCVCVWRENKQKWPGNHQKNHFLETHPKKKKKQQPPPHRIPPGCLYTEDLYALCFIPMHQFSCSAVVAFFKRRRSATAASIRKDFYESSLLQGFLLSCLPSTFHICLQSCSSVLADLQISVAFCTRSTTNRLLRIAAGEAGGMREMRQ